MNAGILNKAGWLLGRPSVEFHGVTTTGIDTDAARVIYYAALSDRPSVIRFTVNGDDRRYMFFVQQDLNVPGQWNQF